MILLVRWDCEGGEGREGEGAGGGGSGVGGATGIVESLVGGVTDGVEAEVEWGVPVPIDLEGPRLV